MTDPVAEANETEGALERFRGFVGGALGLAVLGYLVYAVWHGMEATAAEFSSFRWPLYVPVLALTLVNYGLRYLKWSWLIRALGVRMPQSTNLWAFTAGLGMVVSPGKAGELVKPYVVREVTGTPMATVIPALVAERLTDGIAVVILAAVGVTTFYPDQTNLILGTLASIALGIAILSIESLAHGVFHMLRKLPKLETLVAKLEESYRALRVCLSPTALLVTLAMSLVAWWAECVGYWLVFHGLGVEAGLDASTFLYAFATVFGAPSPGGMGMADVALVEGAVYLIPGVAESKALAAALLVRVATLWFGVLLGVVALLRMDHIIREGRARFLANN